MITKSKNPLHNPAQHRIGRVMGIVVLGLSLALPVLAGGGGGGGGGRGGGGGGGFGGGGGGAGSANNLYGTAGQVGPVTYSIDPISGAVIVFTSDDNYTNVEAVLRGIDRPKPQALIKCVFLEVTYNNGSDYGIEGGILASLSHSQSVTFSNLFGLAAQGITPTSGINTLPGAAMVTLAGDNMAAFIRLIQEKNKVNVLSRPTILARNTQPAQIVVGQQVPVITGVTFSALGQETSTISYINVGIILQVTPFIYPNKDVEMILAPQISEVSPQSTQISGGTNGNFSTPYINTRSANTVVVCPSGQTIVIGGMMQDTKTSVKTGIPGLQSIPLLGNLFRHTQNLSAKTELMIFITPNVLASSEELSRMSMDEVSRSPLSRTAFPQGERNTFIDPTNAPVAFPGSDTRVFEPAQPRSSLR